MSSCKQDRGERTVQLRNVFLMILVFEIAACQDADNRPQPGEPQPRSLADERAAPDEWLGRWQGPEGTYLELRETIDG